jgi:hypothetical protein
MDEKEESDETAVTEDTETVEMIEKRRPVVGPPRFFERNSVARAYAGCFAASRASWRSP